MFVCTWECEAKHVVIIENAERPISERKAILVLSGFGSKFHSAKGQKEALSNTGYDVFIPDYISRKSIDKSAENLEDFMAQQQLEQYDSLYVLAYIFGAWTINHMLNEHAIQNLHSLVYDRSPLQEQVPGFLYENKTLLGRILFGRTLADLAMTPYTEIDTVGISIGILIESKATKIVRKNRDQFHTDESIWRRDAVGQASDDIYYAFVDHDQMYTDLNMVIDEVLNFFKQGNFSSEALREKPSNDPFVDNDGTR